MTGKGTIKATAATGYSSNILLGTLKTDVINGLQDTSTAVATATKLDNFGRAAAAISTDTYDDTTVSVEFSAVEILAE